MKARLMTVVAPVRPRRALRPRRHSTGADDAKATDAKATDPKATVKTPDTPAGRLLAGWLGALGTGKPEALQRFFTANFSKDVLARGTARQRAAGGIRLSQENGGTPELARIERSSAHELVALVQFPVTEAWLRVSVKVAPEPPHTVTQWIVASHSAARCGQREAAVGRGNRRPRGSLPGQAGGGRPLLRQRGRGPRRQTHPLPGLRPGQPGPRRPQPHGHQVQPRLDEQDVHGRRRRPARREGRLAFTDPVGKHLPDYPNKAVAEKVTLHHLLTHTSGVGDYFNDKYVKAAKDRFRTVRDFFPLFVDKPLEFEPGTRFRYSNAGFMILGAVIEKVSGQNYFDYVRDHVYKPAGMADTDAYEMDQDTPNLATGYRRINLQGQSEVGPRRNNLFLHVFKGGPAGGGFSTAEDLIRFAQGAAQPSAARPGADRAGHGRQGGVVSRREIRLRLHGGSGQRPPHRRPQRRLPRHQLASSTSIPVWATTSPSCPTTTPPRRHSSPASSAPSSAGREFPASPVGHASHAASRCDARCKKVGRHSLPYNNNQALSSGSPTESSMSLKSSRPWPEQAQSFG